MKTICVPFWGRPYVCDDKNPKGREPRDEEQDLVRAASQTRCGHPDDLRRLELLTLKLEARHDAR